MSLHTVIEQRAQLDRQITETEHFLRSLKQRRNLLSPAFKLPAEVLNKIFVFCRDLCFESDGLETTWMAVAEVCSAWRAAAVECSALWNCIYIDSGLNCTHRNTVKYAKKRYLKVRINFQGRKPSSDCLRKSVVNRMQCLSFEGLPRLFDVDGPSDDERDEIPGLLLPAPVLENLYAHGVLDFGDRSSFPLDLFRGEVPNLRYASFDKVSLHWTNMAFLRNVQEFTLRDSRICGDPQSMLNTLSKLTNVRLIEFSTVDVDVDPGPTPAVSQITLPQLTKLGFESSGEWLHIFFGALNAPRLTCCDIMLDWPPNDEVNLMIMSFLSQFYRTLETRGLFPHGLDIGDHYVRIWDRNMPDISFTYHLGCHTYPSHPHFRWLNEVVNAIGGENIRRLCLTSYHHPDPIAPWDSIASRLVTLESIYLTDLVNYGYLSPSTILDNIREGPILPSLRDVRISKFIPINPVVQWLNAWKERNFELESIGVASDHEDVNSINELRQLVPRTYLIDRAGNPL
jgi:hypothetical protein